MERLTDQRHSGKINGHHARGCKCVSKAALEDNIHVHQTVSDDGVTKAQRNQRQRTRRRLHPRRRNDAENVGHDVEQQERNRAGKSAARNPFELLPQNGGGSPAVTHQENHGSDEEINPQIRLLHFIEPVARAYRRQEIERAASDENVQGQKSRPESRM